MMNLQEAKLHGEFAKSGTTAGHESDERFSGLVHLFQHRYLPHIEFWYAVMQISISQEFVRQFVFEANLEPLEIVLDLEDGRRGIAEITETFIDDESILLAMVGHSRLQVPTRQSGSAVA